MVVISTQFQHKQIHKGTWRYPDNNTINQIDHVLINQSKKEAKEDVRFLRDPNIDSDNYLLKTTLKQKLPNIYIRKPTQLIKWNKTNLQDPSKLRQYTDRILLQNKLENTLDRATSMKNGKE